MTRDEFQNWLVAARRGDRIVYGYATGRLPSGRLYGPDPETMAAAYKAYEQGKVLLFQKRQGSDCYTFIAIRCTEQMMKAIGLWVIAQERKLCLV